MSDTESHQEIARLQSQITALEQLLEVHERTAVEQSERLEQAMTELRQAKLQSEFQVATLEQLLEVHERTTIEQAEQLERTMAALQVAKLQSEERLHTVITNVPVIIFTLDRQGIFTLSEGKGLAALGLQPGQVVGRSVFDVYKDEPLLLSDVERALAGEAFSSTSQMGTLVFETWYTPLRDPSGELAGTIGVSMNITERQQAESALRESEAKFKALADNLAVGFFIHQEGVARYIGREGIRMLGYDSADQMVGRPIMDFVHEAERARIADLARRRIAGESIPDRYETRFLRKDGTSVDVLLSNVVIEYEGRPATQGTFTDITERKQVEDNLRATRQQLLDIIDFLPDATFVIDRDKKVIAWNRAAEEMTDTRKEDILGQGDYAYAVPWWGERRPMVVDLIGMEDSEFRAKYDFVQKIGSNTLYAEVFVPRVFGGRGGYMAATAAPLLDGAGNMVGAIESVRDITDRKRLEQQIQESLERRGRQVQTSTEVAQEIAAAPALEELFQRVVTLVKERFDYYHTQIFRYDPAQDTVVLVTGYGEPGHKMLAAGHKLATGRGVVGTAAATGKSILATDTAQDPDWRPNPNLPDTQGELAVPIKLRNEVLGILDVQSNQAGALTTDDQLLLEGLCGQIAIAVENRRAEEVLRASEAELAEALRTARLANWEYDVASDTFTFNDQFYALLRTTAEREGGYTMSSAQYTQRFVHPEDAPLVGEEVVKAIQATDPNFSRQLDHRFFYADGGMGYITVRFRIQKDAQGRTIKTFGANQDITERKLAEVTLREAEERFRVISETVPIPILISSLADGKVLYGNENLGETFGLPIQDLIGRQTPDFYFDPADRRLLMEQLKRDGMLRDYELHVKKFDGTLFWVLVTMRQMVFANQPALFAAFYDVTERKQAEAQMQETLRELERLNRATTREGWQAFLRTGQLAPAYQYDRTAVQPAQELQMPQIEQAIQQNTLVPPSAENAVAVAPLSVRGAVVGALGVYDDPKQPLSSDELALLQEIIEQGALALENARLYQDTQRTAARERLLNEITARIRAAATLEGVLNSAVQEIGQVAGADYAAIDLELDSAA